MADLNFFDSIDKNGNKVQGYGLGAIDTGINLFGAWNAYQAMLNQRKNSLFNRKVASANYTNQAKASNADLDKYTRYRQMLSGRTTDSTNRYMNSDAYRNKRFKETL